ncbi:MAG: hypothetical protein GC185_02440 [Alphaproteobacteria bacterium]|nr:hypothetical protein [Alphaproteobacteria bacterium]
MISESVIVFGSTGNVVMIINGELPKNVPIMFKIGESQIELMSDEDTIYAEEGLSPYICTRLREQNEIGLVEVMDSDNPPKHLTNIAYQAAS